MQSKRCYKCGETKTVSGFSRDRSRSDGLSSRCKECCRDYLRTYRKEHRDECAARNRAYYKGHREACAASNLAYRRAHRDEISEQQFIYREANREELNAKRRTYREANRDELNAQIRKIQQRSRCSAREVATRNGEQWTQAEDHIALTAEGTVLDIAIQLGRTIGSVNSRRAYLQSKAVTA